MRVWRPLKTFFWYMFRHNRPEKEYYILHVPTRMDKYIIIIIMTIIILNPLSDDPKMYAVQTGDVGTRDEHHQTGRLESEIRPTTEVRQQPNVYDNNNNNTTCAYNIGNHIIII